MTGYIGIFKILTLLAVIFSGSKQYPASAVRVEKDNYDVSFYHLDLNVSDTSTYISGSTTIFIKIISASEQSIVFDYSSQLVTDSVVVSNLIADYTHESNEITITPPQVINEGDVVPVTIYYHGLGKNYQADGIFNRYASSWDKNVTWTLSEPFGAYSWFPCKQSLTDKADSVYVFLSTDKTLKAGSNGLLTAEVPLPGERVRYEWKSRYPIAYYLISLTISDYMDYSFYVKERNGIDSILIQNYIYNDSNYLDQNKASIDKTGDLMLLYSDLFGPYPFNKEKYGHCVAPFSGGMEHQTMTTLVNFSFLLVAHELAHQWFGDYITCATWQDIWINEGFASYAEYLACQYLLSQDDADRWIINSTDYVKSSPGGSVYVPADQAKSEGRIFDSRLSYKKGAAIIHMIRQETNNDSLFFNILQTFVEKYKNGNVTGNDFKEHVESKTNLNFDQFFNQWYFGQGYPIHSIRWHHKNDSLYISSLQTVSSVTPFFNVLLEFKAVGENTDTIISFRQEQAFEEWQIYLPGNITSLQADPNHWLLIDLSDINILPDIQHETGFTIVPNPAKDMIRIRLDQPIGNYTILLTNSAGKILMKRQSSFQNEEIHVSNYPPGIYFIIINNKNTTQRGKFIIN